MQLSPEAELTFIYTLCFLLDSEVTLLCLWLIYFIHTTYEYNFHVFGRYYEDYNTKKKGKNLISLFRMLLH